MEYFDRREFIRNLAATLAASTAGLTFNSCTTVRGAYRQSRGPVDVNAVLAALNQQSKHIAQYDGLKFAENYLHKCGCNPYLIKDSVISLLAVGTFGDLPDQDKEHPAVQQMLRNTSPVMDRAVLCAATYLENLSREERLGIQKTLKEHPEILRTFQVEFDAAARGYNIQSNRLEHFNAVFNKCAWRLENQDPALMIDELVAITDKTCRECSFEPGDRRKMAAEFGSAGCYEAAFGTYFSTAYANGRSKPKADYQQQTRAYKKWRKTRKVGVGMSLFGLGQFGVGTLMLVSGIEGVNIFGLVAGMTGGALLIIAGLITALIGSIGMAVTHEDQKQWQDPEANEN